PGGAGRNARRTLSNSALHELLELSSVSTTWPAREQSPMSRTHPSPNASSDVPNAPSAPMLRRSLEELAGSERFQKLLEQEFSEPLGDSPDHVTRRSFLALMGASLALAGATGCR